MSEELSKSQLKKQKKLQEREARKKINQARAHEVVLPDWVLAEFKAQTVGDPRFQFAVRLGFLLFYKYDVECSFFVSQEHVRLELDDQPPVCEITSPDWHGIKWFDTDLARRCQQTTADGVALLLMAWAGKSNILKEGT